jgi:hypothetical protein
MTSRLGLNNVKRVADATCLAVRTVRGKHVVGVRNRNDEGFERD